MLKKLNNNLNKPRKVIDANTTILEIIQHSFVNFLYGFLSGLTISAISLNNPLIIFGSYYLLKQTEGRILNRHKYVTKLGKNYIFPIPSTVGFLSGWKISLVIKEIWVI
jgi:hypothetical protein